MLLGHLIQLRYSDRLLNIDETHFEQMVDKLNPKDPQLDEANSSGIEYLFLDLNLSISNDIILSKNYDKEITLLLTL